MKKSEIAALAPTSVAVVGINAPNRDQAVLPGMPPAAYTVNVSIFNLEWDSIDYDLADFEVPGMDSVSGIDKLTLVQRIRIEALLDSSLDDVDMVNKIIADIRQCLQRDVCARVGLATGHGINAKDVPMMTDIATSTVGRNIRTRLQLSELVDGVNAGEIEGATDYAPALAEVTSKLLACEYSALISWLDPRTIDGGYTYPATYSEELADSLARRKRYSTRSMRSTDYTGRRGYPIEVAI